jgi:glycosyltransferase involved in cell wall biosynthesis
VELEHREALASNAKLPSLSIIIPTYNESGNILKLIEAIKSNLPSNIISEIVVVDDNSPDGTGKIVENYINNHISIDDIPIQQQIHFKLIITKPVWLKLSIGETRLVLFRLF